MSFEAAWSNGMQFPEKEAYSIRKLEALSVKLPPALHGPCVLLSKEHQNFIAEGRYILATTSLKLRA
jgi:hypothetical protein